MNGAVYTINLDYRCNERCVFCAADLGGDVPAAIRRPSLTLTEIRRHLAGNPPRSSDRVVLSGGEPTLHRELLPIVTYLAGNGAQIALFTNAMRLSNPALARATAAAGVTDYEVSIYGPTAAEHDARTRRPGSLRRTLAALEQLCRLRAEFGVTVSIRLLISRHTVSGNTRVVEMIDSVLQRVDSFSLNKLVLSNDAIAADAPISWATASESVNACARLITTLGYQLECADVPLCVLDDDVRGVALSGCDRRPEPPKAYHYLDPLQAPGQAAPHRRSALPDVCLGCGLAGRCGGVERGYLLQFGASGLRTQPA